MSNPGETKTPEKKRRRSGWLILLLLLLFGAAFYITSKGGFDWQAQYAALKTWFYGAPQPEEKTERAFILPTFDVVRAEPTGELVVAGRAEPGWTVRLESGEAIIGQSQADKNGEWVLQPEQPLPEGDHSLSLRALDADGKQSVIGKQRVAMSIAGKSKPLVALSDEGKPTRILQKPDADGKADAGRGADKIAAAKPVQLLDEKQPGASKDDAKQSAAKGENGAKGQGGDAAAAKPAQAMVTFSAIDYEFGSKGGIIFMNGQAGPNARVMLYVDNVFIGETTAAPNGAWNFSGRRDLARGTHLIRGDQVDAASGKVLARAEVSFEQNEPEEKSIDIAAAEKDGKDTAPAATADVKTGADAGKRATAVAEGPIKPDTAAAARQKTGPAPGPSPDTKKQARDGGDAVASIGREAGEKASPRETAQRSAPAKRTAYRRKRKARGACAAVVVRRGDTLWHIARRCYGDGERYTKIFRSNQGQIRDPDLIYPNQRFVIPR